MTNLYLFIKNKSNLKSFISKYELNKCAKNEQQIHLKNILKKDELLGKLNIPAQNKPNKISYELIKGLLNPKVIKIKLSIQKYPKNDKNDNVTPIPTSNINILPQNTTYILVTKTSFNFLFKLQPEFNVQLLDKEITLKSFFSTKSINALCL